MPSPFPGMNPYIERRDMWADFHDRYLVELSNALVRQVMPNYVVKIEEFVYLHDVSAEERELAGRPDLSVLPERRRPAAGGVALLDSPAVVSTPPELELDRLSFLEVRDRLSREVVTAIEVLSPTNKSTGPDREQHERKWRMLLASPVHVVEIDLLRSGRRMPWVDIPPCDYCVAVSRAADRPRVNFWPVFLRDRLPQVPVPLREGEAEPLIDLQAVLHKVYDDAGYAYHLYQRPPEPRLPPPDDAWAAEIARAATPTA